MKKALLNLATICSFCAFASFALAEDAKENQDLSIAMQALPELAEELQNNSSQKSSAIRMKCFVDTPAFDLFTFGTCFSVGTALTTSAVFAIDNVPAGSTVLWSNSNCSQTNTFCTLPIRQYQSVNLSATILKPDGTFSQTSATAFYEGFL